MKEIVEVIAKSLVDHPEAVVVDETQDDQEIILRLRVAEDDMGKVIGKQGRIARPLPRRRISGRQSRLAEPGETACVMDGRRFCIGEI